MDTVSNLEAPLELSVIICSRNPRREYFQRVLEALKAQSLEKSRWELLLVDSASDIPLENSEPISWHGRHRYVRVGEPGSALARIRGVEAALGRLLVFVDDDNVLNPDYLEEAVALGNSFPQLGIWGGSTLPVYEMSPPEWFHEHASMIAVREISRDLWSNIPRMEEPWVIGAGMVVRRELALEYAAIVRSDPRRLFLSRAPDGRNLGGEDLDMVLSVCDRGFGRGVFKSLVLHHLIPAHRCTGDYLESIMVGNAASVSLIQMFRDGTAIPPHVLALRHLPYRMMQWWRSRHACRYEKMRSRTRRKGLALAEKLFLELSQTLHPIKKS
jgi:glycosyltransferase involved in cell wall biosynthesis